MLRDIVSGIADTLVRAINGSARAEPRRTCVDVAWVGRITMPLSPSEAVSALPAILCKRQGCIMRGHVGREQFFARGDHCSTYMPVCMDTWLTFPMFIDLQYGREDGKTAVDVTFKAPDGYVMFGDDADEFYHLAAVELDVMTRYLREWRDAQQRDEADDEAEDEDDEEAGSAEDYAALELNPGASWAEVQAAYRESCLRYHPDRLVGQPKHLVDLASREFRIRTEAYHRLKERLVG